MLVRALAWESLISNGPKETYIIIVISFIEKILVGLLFEFHCLGFDFLSGVEEFVLSLVDQAASLLPPSSSILRL